MSSKSKNVSLSSGTVLSIFCLLLYSAGFIRIEVKLNNHEERLVAVEELISKMSSQTSKNGMDDTSTEGRIRGGLIKQRSASYFSSNLAQWGIVYYHTLSTMRRTTKRNLCGLVFFFPRAFSFTWFTKKRETLQEVVAVASFWYIWCVGHV